MAPEASPPSDPLRRLPRWVPESAQAYLAHACVGRPLREVAAAQGCAPSTILRQVRRIEARRDDPLVDDAMDRLAQAVSGRPQNEGYDAMSAMPPRADLIDDETLRHEACRILRRLCEGEAFLAVGQGMDQAVILRGEDDPTRIATLARAVAQAFVLKDWIGCYRAGKITRYRITEAGRAALRRFLAEKHQRKVEARGMAEAPSPFLAQHAEIAETPRRSGDGAEMLRINLAESPLGALARRRGRDGQPFLGTELVLAGETLREDFERAQMGPKVGQNWDRFLTAGVDGGALSDAMGGNDGARKKVATATARARSRPRRRCASGVLLPGGDRDGRETDGVGRAVGQGGLTDRPAAASHALCRGGTPLNGRRRPSGAAPLSQRFSTST